VAKQRRYGEGECHPRKGPSDGPFDDERVGEYFLG